MKKRFAFMLIILILFISSGCTKVVYSENFSGIPIFPSAKQLMNEKLGETQCSEIYLVSNFKGDFEKVVDYYMNKTDKNIWNIEEMNNNLKGNVDDMMSFKLTSSEKEVMLTLTYSEGEKTSPNITISLIGKTLEK